MQISVDHSTGYGDSTGHPDEAGIVEDAKRAYLYAREQAPHSAVFVWGHSMGTGVAAKAVQELSEIGMPPDGLVLESPFNNLRDVVLNHPFSMVGGKQWDDGGIVYSRFDGSRGLTRSSSIRCAMADSI